MKVTKEKTENSQAFLTIEMEPEEIEEGLQVAYHRLVVRAKIPGFRPGKAPREVLERHLGKSTVLEDALNYLIPKAYQQAVKEQSIEPIAQPKIELAQTNPVIFKAVVPLRPKVELGDYHQVNVKQPEVEEITEDKVDTVIEMLRHQYATWEPVERPVNFDDLVFMDIEGKAGEESFVKSQALQYQVLKDSKKPVPGFAEQLIGMTKGEEKEFRLGIPDDFYKKELVGKEASFKVKVLEIKQENLPELNDDFAKRANPDIGTMKSLREQVATNLKQAAEENARKDFERQVVEAAAAQAKLEFPQVFVDEEIDHLFVDQARLLQLDGRGLEQYLKSMDKTEEQVREELRPVATKRVTQALVLGKIAEAEKLEVNEAEIDAEIDNMLKGAPEKMDKAKVREQLSSPQSRDSLKHSLLTRKTIERLVEIARSQGTVQLKGKEEEK